MAHVKRSGGRESSFFRGRDGDHTLPPPAPGSMLTHVDINAVIGLWSKPSIGGALLLLVEGEHPDVGFFEIAVEVKGAIISG